MRARRPGHHVCTCRGDAKRQARCHALGDRDHVWLDAEVLDGEHLSGTPHPRLHLVGNQQDAVLIRDLAKTMVEPGLGNNVPALALDGFDDDPGDFVWGDQVHEQLVFKEVEALRLARLRLQPDRAAVTIAVRSVKRASLHRAKTATLNRFARCQ